MYEERVAFAKEKAPTYAPNWSWAPVQHGTKFSLGSTTLTIYKNGNILIQGADTEEIRKFRNEILQMEETKEVEDKIETLVATIEANVAELKAEIKRLKKN